MFTTNGGIYLKTKGQRQKNLIKCAAILTAMSFVASGCSFMNPEEEVQETVSKETGFIAMKPGMYDSEDMALVVKKDTQAQTIQFQNLSTGKRYTLSYDGATKILDKYDQALSLEQIETGSIVDAKFYKPKKMLASIKIPKDCISFSNIDQYKLDIANGKITVGQTTYDFNSNIVVISGEEEAQLMDVNQMDVISVWGYNNQIYGINIERGHGYLRLQNDTYFVGGWIEAGQSVIKKITEDMLLTVPEGKLTVSVNNKGSSATQTIDFVRNQEMVWDLGDVEITRIQTGKIVFTLNPANAKVTIDGKNVDASKPVELEYGIHQMTVTADGYDAVAQYIKVAEPSANVSVELEKSEDSDEESETSQESSSQESSTAAATEEKLVETSKDKKESEDEETPDTSQSEEQSSQAVDKTESKTSSQTPSTSYKVHIDSPTGVEVYLDGNYIGVAPVDFAKTAGNYVVTLRKTGYQSRSYTLQIDDEDKDVTYSFSDLMKLE